jgi:hypothetical protein
MNDNEQFSRDDRKAAIKAGWLFGASNPLFFALPFLFPKTADRLAGKFDDKLNAMLYPPPEHPAPVPVPAPTTAAANRFELYLLAIVVGIGGLGLLVQLFGG